VQFGFVVQHVGDSMDDLNNAVAMELARPFVALFTIGHHCPYSVRIVARAV
jgi:hypothetical protein